MYIGEPGASNMFEDVIKWYRLDTVNKYPDLYKRLLKAYDKDNDRYALEAKTGMRMEYNNSDIIFHKGVVAINISKDGSITIQHPKEFKSEGINENRPADKIKADYTVTIQTLATATCAAYPEAVEFSHKETTTSFLL